jgi:hypothetical protein
MAQNLANLARNTEIECIALQRLPMDKITGLDT